jgi:2-amino-4-hydroxy-6-hydroxymethyldihydropteridine diphosphokinase
MKPIYIAVGANMSNPKETLIRLPSQLNARGVFVKKTSSLWRNPAWPAGLGYPDYLNGVFEVEFTASADDLLTMLHALENAAGRRRSIRNAPRPLDLDILDFRGEVRESLDLQLPHPRMNDRAFVMLPLAEIAPNWRHPLTHITAIETLAQLSLSDMEAMSFETHISSAD